MAYKKQWRAMKARVPTYGHNGESRILVANGICLKCRTKITDDECACSVYPAGSGRPLNSPSAEPNPGVRPKLRKIVNSSGG